MITREQLELNLLNHMHSRSSESDVAHDIGHLKRVLKTSMAILKEEGRGHPKIVTAAALLHDYIALPKNHPERHMASRLSAEMAVKLLVKMDFPKVLLPDTINAIEAHSYSANIKPTCIEACIIQDADRLDALGAIGIARCFAVSGHIDRPIFNSEDPLGRNRKLESNKWGVDYFLSNLIKLPETMNTDSAKLIAQERVKYLQEFLEKLESEVLDIPIIPQDVPLFSI